MVSVDSTEQTLASLRALCDAGALYVITPLHLCQPGGLHLEKMTPEQVAICERSIADRAMPPLLSPYHFERRQVVRIEGPDGKGRYAGYTDDGSFTMGYPAALLKRLTQTMLAEKPEG